MGDIFRFSFLAVYVTTQFGVYYIARPFYVVKKTVESTSTDYAHYYIPVTHNEYVYGFCRISIAKTI